MGIGALQRDKQRLALFQQKGTNLAREELEKLTSQMGEFRSNLEKFAQKYRKDIKRDPDFRRKFQQMCAVAGVDPLRSSANFWGKLLGVGDFYYELAIQIVEVFLTTSDKNGGIMTIEELLSSVISSRNVNLKKSSSSKSDQITSDDILVAIKKLKSLGSNITEIPSNRSYIIHATPAELNSDHVVITQVAHSTHGYVSFDILKERFDEWSDERVQKALDELMMEGLIWLDEQDSGGKPLFWFSGLN